MLSIEYILLILIFLVYISAWYVYLDKIILATDVAVSRFEMENYANEMSNKINTLCFSEGVIYIEYNNEVNVEIENNLLQIGNVERKLNCPVQNIKLNKNNYKIEKSYGIIFVT